MQSVMKHNFSKVPQVDRPRSSFDRSHGYKTTFDCDYLIPFYTDEVLPGDTFNVNATLFARANTLLVPIMDNMYLDTFYFFVPWRLVWANFPKFMGEQVDPGDSTDYQIPVLTSRAATVGTISDYFGLPIGPTLSNVSGLFHRAYARIWNSWFRDENLQDSEAAGTDTGDGPNDRLINPVLKRCKRHDYFTSALPWPMKPNALGSEISMPLGTSATVLTSSSDLVTSTSYPLHVRDASSGAALSTTYNLGQASGVVTTMNASTGGAIASGDVFPSNLYADLSSATAASISSLREAFQLQRMMELEARCGTRYPEIIMGHFGVRDPQFAVLQRPEFLGGGRSPLNVTPVAQTGEAGTTAQGNLAAYGTIASSRNGFTKSFTEHGCIIGILCVTADLTYQQGLPRMFSRSTKWDFFWPSLQNLSEQAILNKEIYYQGTSADEDVFGYIGRYDEYRHKNSQITGKLRSTYATSLDLWHMSEEFSTLPTLSSTFIQSNTPFARSIAVPSEPHFVLDSYIQCHTVRAMGTYAIPGMIDHF